MSGLNSLTPPSVEGLGIELHGPAEIKLSGTIVMKEPRDTLGVFFRQVHDAMVAQKLPDLVVDVTSLTFVNSSSIRLFVDLATWVKKDGSPYRLTFRSRRSIAWQRTAFMALQSLAKGVLRIEYAA